MEALHQPGGAVFTAGTTEVGRALTGADPVIERITANLLTRLPQLTLAEPWLTAPKPNLPVFAHQGACKNGES